MAQRPPDPVSDPAQYQRFLLGLLADDDPADVQAATPTRIRALVAEAGDRLRTRPKPDEWSVLECIGHIVDGGIGVERPLPVDPRARRAATRRLRPGSLGRAPTPQRRRRGRATFALRESPAREPLSMVTNAGGRA